MSKCDPNNVNNVYNEMREQVRQAVQAEGFHNAHAVYSAYTENANGILVNNLNETAVKGKVKFTVPAYAVETGERPRTALFEDPTWLDATVALEQLIRMTGDYHHVFLEDIKVEKEENGVKICNIMTGS